MEDCEIPEDLVYCTINIAIVNSFIILPDSPIVRQLQGMIPEMILRCKLSKNMTKSARTSDNPTAQSDSSNLSSNKRWHQHCVLAGKGIRLTQRKYKYTHFSLHCVKLVGGECHALWHSSTFDWMKDLSVV